jgi:hypothetical protein
MDHVVAHLIEKREQLPDERLPGLGNEDIGIRGHGPCILLCIAWKATGPAVATFKFNNQNLYSK